MFVELKCKSNFSFLRGASDSREYIVRASELRMPALAITDLNGVYAIPRAYETLKTVTDVKLIVGSEITLSDHPNITLIAKTKLGYSLLCQILSALHSGKDKGLGSLSLNEFLSIVAEDQASSDLIVLPDLKTETKIPILKDAFKEGLFLPVCQYLDGLDEERMNRALEQACFFHLPLAATNDVYYHHPSRQMLQDSLTCIREKVTLKSAGMRIFKNNERYLKSPLQMRALFKELPEAIKNTLKIAEQCTFQLSELSYQYPKELIPEGMTPEEYLESLILEGAHRIYKGIIPSQVDSQIQSELKLIRKKQYESYFLTIYDIVEFARKNKILCQGRGSAANSITCYCLGITVIDPVRMNLLFERFMSEERTEPPDIDVDFEHERREEVIQYIYRRFGRDRAAMVSAVRTYQPKSSFLELSKVFSIPVGVCSADTLARDFDQIAGNLKSNRPLIESLAEDLKDFPRHLSIHSGGFTLSHEPITTIVPIEPARMEGRTITQWDKNDLDTVGLLKLDILSLGFLTALHKCLGYLKLSWYDIPDEDPKTYEMIGRAETEGCFQIESRAQKAMLPKTLPKTFYDLVVQVAIVRPGPSVGQMINPYLKRREAARRGKPYILPDPELEHALGRTYGVPIFQEQIMKVAILKAGFSPGEADQLRRAIASWRSAEAVSVVSEKLYQGLLKGGVPESFAKELFEYLKGYAHYGFPESHAASFAKIAYTSAYLKCHHPAAFLCALINSQPMGFYAIDTLINEAKRNGVTILPIHPNSSTYDARLENSNTVLMGFRNVRRIRAEDVKWMNENHEREVKESDYKTQIKETEIQDSYFILEAEREKRPFDSLYDFLKRTKFSRDINELMALANVFHCFGKNQRYTYWQILSYHELLSEKSSAQLSLFTKNPHPKESQAFLPEMSLYETIFSEYKALGYSVQGNLMMALRKMLPDLPKLTSRTIKNFKKGKEIDYAGILTVHQRPPTAKGTAFLTIEDDDGSLDFVLKKNTYEEFSPIIKNNRFLRIKGIVQRSGLGVSILASEVQAFHVKSATSVGHGVTSRGFGKPI